MTDKEKLDFYRTVSEINCCYNCENAYIDYEWDISCDHSDLKNKITVAPSNLCNKYKAEKET